MPVSVMEQAFFCLYVFGESVRYNAIKVATAASRSVSRKNLKCARSSGDRALVSGARSRRFESSRAHHFPHRFKLSSLLGRLRINIRCALRA